MNYFKVFLIMISMLLSNALFASGNTSGGGGKASGQVSSGSSRFEGKIDELKNKIVKDNMGEKGKAFDHSHQIFSGILSRNIKVLKGGQGSQIDYKNIDKKKLSKYIDESLKLSKNVVDRWKKSEQQAYYFNLYNALTIQLVLKSYPIKSIKDLGSGFPLFRSAWKKKFFKLFGDKSYLDRIEHELLRGNKKLMDPLAHFAFNCASIGCPALLKEAFISSRLEAQLQKATRNFLSDRSRNYLKGKTLYVSNIFKWYGDDFEEGYRNINSLKDFFALYSDSISSNEEDKKVIKSRDYEIDYTDYNWNLNDFK